MDDRVVFSLPLSADAAPELQLVTLAAGRVDWPRTERYATAARATHYAATRAEDDYAQFSNQVAAVLTGIAREPDPKRRLAVAESARTRHGRLARRPLRLPRRRRAADAHAHRRGDQRAARGRRPGLLRAGAGGVDAADAHRAAAAAAHHRRARRAAPGRLDDRRTGRSRHAAAAAGAVHRPRGGVVAAGLGGAGADHSPRHPGRGPGHRCRLRQAHRRHSGRRQPACSRPPTCARSSGCGPGR